MNLLTRPRAMAARAFQVLGAASGQAPGTQLIASLRPQSKVVVSGMIRTTGTVTIGSSFAYGFTLVDGSGEVDVLFLGRRSVAGLHPGTRVTIEGRVGSHDCRVAFWNPRYQIEPGT